MKIVLNIILAILVFLALAAGVTKIMLMPQDVEFFGKYGFTNSILIAYGAAQVIGGILLIIQRARFIGAIIVAITFLISAVVLVMDRNILVTIVTLVAVFLLGVIMKQSLKKEKSQPT